AEVTTVPKIATAAPKIALTGSQAAVQRNATPKCPNAARAPIASDAMIAITVVSTINENIRVVLTNSASSHRARRNPSFEARVDGSSNRSLRRYFGAPQTEAPSGPWICWLQALRTSFTTESGIG